MVEVDDILKGVECCDAVIHDRKCENCPYLKFKKPYITVLKCSDYLMHDLKDLLFSKN